MVSRRSARFVGVVCAAWTQFGVAAAGEPDAASERATRVAMSHERVVRCWEALKREAEAISNEEWRRAALSILEVPTLGVLAARAAEEAEIVDRLVAEGLLGDDRPGVLLPILPASPFVAAAGGTWNGHHAYPGGLVYHTLVNVRLGLGMAEVYSDVYGVPVESDVVRVAAIWHDVAKTVTIPWQVDGTLGEEGKIAGTGAHHAIGVAEALYRGFPSEVVVAIASAHGPPAGDDLQSVLDVLRAATIIAGTDPRNAGLTAAGDALRDRPPIEAFINHLCDQDYVFTRYSLETVTELLDEAAGDPGDHWSRHDVLARDGDVAVYAHLLQGGQTARK